MLMFCDELQCWDRTAYGRNSKHELHPMETVLDLSSDNLFKIKYVFDTAEKAKIDEYEEEYARWLSDHRGKCPKLKAYSSMHQTEKISMLESFTSEELAKIGPLEHKRWLEEHYEMGWEYASKEELEEIVKEEMGTSDISSDEFKKAFMIKRENWGMIPHYEYSGDELKTEEVRQNYDHIGQEEQYKDTKPMEHMVGLLKRFDGLPIYRFA